MVGFVVIVLVILVLVALLYAALLYNALGRKRNRIDNAWAHIELQVARRAELTGADQALPEVQAEIADRDATIAASREAYEATLDAYNKAIRAFPAVLFAGSLGFAKREPAP